MTFHILAIGQSNVANHCGSPSESAFGEVMYEGQIHQMKDPIFGGTGDLGSVWPRLANRLHDENLCERLRLTMAAQGNASIEEWAPGGAAFEIAAARLDAGDGDGVTHVIFQQGEKDTLLETAEQEYAERFLRLHEAISARIGVLPWIICQSSYRFGVTSAAVIAAQKHLAHAISAAVAGPYLDALGSDFRSDDTHFNDAGLDVFAESLSKILAQNTRYTQSILTKSQ